MAPIFKCFKNVIHSAIFLFSDLFDIDKSGEIPVMTLSEEFLERYKSTMPASSSSNYTVGKLSVLKFMLSLESCMT